MTWVIKTLTGDQWLCEDGSLDAAGVTFPRTFSDVNFAETYIRQSSIKIPLKAVHISASPAELKVIVQLERLKSYCRSVRFEESRAVREDGELMGYWQTGEWIEGLLSLCE